MAIKLTTLSSVKAYFQNLATKHKQIDGYKFGNKEVVINDGRDLAQTFLWAQPYEFFRYSGGADNLIKNKPIKVAVFTVPDSDRFEDEEAAYDYCEAIIEDIVSVLVRDKRGAMVGEEWESLASNSSTWKGTPIEHIISSTKYIGCELSIEFMDNTRIAYDESKWN